MANQVVGTGSVEIIFDYEKNLKKSINDIKKTWSSSGVGDAFKQIDSSIISLNKNTEKAVISIKKVSKSQDDNQKLIEKAMKITMANSRFSINISHSLTIREQKESNRTT